MSRFQKVTVPRSRHSCRWLLVLWMCLGCPLNTAGLDGSGAERPTILAVPCGVTAAMSQPIEQDLRTGTVGLLRGARWWFRHTWATLQRATRAWWRWLAEAAVFLLVAAVAAVVDLKLVRQCWAQGWRALRSSVPLAGLVYLLTLFDRSADRLGRIALFGALVYGVSPWDLIPDRGLSIGLVEDVVIIAATSRWFVGRTQAEVIERNAGVVAAWLQRTRSIRRRRG